MDRRGFLAGLGCFVPLTGGVARADAGAGGAWSAAPATPALVFEDIEAIAATASTRPHRQPKLALPGRFAQLDYDAYRRIRPRADAALWQGGDNQAGDSRFAVDLLHPGFLFNDAIEMATVSPHGVRPLPFEPERFDYDGAPPPDPEGLSYSGLRLRYPLNAPATMDEVAVFQGASYFRAVGAGDFYGLSARGLALDVGAPEGEEFPFFSRFWMVEPRSGAPGEPERVTLFALLESPSTTGAYAFVIQPGAETVIDVRATLYPRRPLAHVGVAPLTSMFLFDPSDRQGVDDFRGAVHDSNGLQILTGAGERIWRPLANPRRLQVSSFVDRGPQGFGLQQRARRFDYYQDAEAAYERRASAWIEPDGDWGPGAVTLVEIPVRSEIHDNIVAYWRPAEPLAADRPHRFGYRMRWAGRAGEPDGLARVVGTRTGLAPNDGRRRVIVDFEGDPEVLGQAAPRVSASTGVAAHPTISALPDPGRYRVAFVFEPDDDRTSELRLQLATPAGACSETWLYRWTAP